MATFIKAGFWEKLCKPCKGYKGWLNLDQFVEERASGLPYKIYTATVTWNRIDGVVDVNVMQNTLGNVDFEYIPTAYAGFYVTSSNLFTENKTFVLMNGYNWNDDSYLASAAGTSCTIQSESQLTINFDGYGNANNTDNNLTGFIEIRVYP